MLSIVLVGVAPIFLFGQYNSCGNHGLYAGSFQNFVNVWNLDRVKLCECSNLLIVFHNFAYEVSKVAFVIAPGETSRSKQIRRGGATVVRDLIFGGKISCCWWQNFPLDLAAFCQIRKASNPVF